MKKVELLVKHLLGEKTFEALQKAILKLPTKTVVDITEAADALSIAPKSVMAFLMKELTSMDDKGAKEVQLPFDENCMMLINKHANDVYSGHIAEKGKIVHEFKNVSIPQLSSHLLSYFELYDEPLMNEKSREESSEESVIEKEQSKEESKEEKSSNDMQNQLDALSKKIDQLFLIAAQSKSPQIIVAAPVEKAEESKIEKLKKLKKTLKKAGVMPKPPQPGAKVGGSNGITKQGIHGFKTTSTDANKPKKTSLAPPALKSMTFNKSELSRTCVDCKHAVPSCLCFKALSKPTVTKSEKGMVTLTFKEDWDLTSLQAFYRTLKRYRND